MIGNKIADKITKIPETLKQNNSGTDTNECNKEIPTKDIYLQKKDRKLLRIWDLLDSIIRQYKNKKCWIIRQINHLNLEQKMELK